MSHFSPAALTARQERAARAFGDDADLVLISCGEPLSIPGGLDQVYDFVPHPEYYWLTGSRRPGGVMAYTPDSGWLHFVRPVTAEEKLWEGSPAAPEGEDIAELDRWLQARSAQSVAALGAGTAPLDAKVSSAAELVAELQPRLDAVRRAKDEEEIALMRRCAAVTAAGHAAARDFVAVGVSERAIQIELEAEMRRQGADAVGYSTIVGIGTNAGVLHFAPGERVASAEDLVLIDAGGAIAGYTADVTRTYAAGGTFSGRQQQIYDIVKEALLHCNALCTAGREWHDVHRAAARTLAEGLRHVGLLSGDVDGLLESEAIALFFPHGIGHMVGLGVRDVGGHSPEREPGRKCCGARVRVDLPLESGFIMTVEPGLYFVPAILEDAAHRERFGNAVAWSALDDWWSVGGVRLEDNLVVTAGEPENLTEEIPL